MSIDGLNIIACNRMDSVTKENTIDVSLDVSEHLGGLVLKEEQKLAVEALLSGKDVMAILPTGFGKSIIYQSFVVSTASRRSVDSSLSPFLLFPATDPGDFASLLNRRIPGS